METTGLAEGPHGLGIFSNESPDVARGWAPTWLSHLAQQNSEGAEARVRKDPAARRGDRATYEST